MLIDFFKTHKNKYLYINRIVDKLVSKKSINNLVTWNDFPDRRIYFLHN